MQYFYFFYFLGRYSVEQTMENQPLHPAPTTAQHKIENKTVQRDNSRTGNTTGGMCVFIYQIILFFYIYFNFRPVCIETTS